MLTIPSNIQTLLNTGRASIRWLIRFELGGGAVGLWNDDYSVTYNGLVYTPLAGNMEVAAIPGRMALDSDQLQIKVANLKSAVAGVVDGVDWHQRPVTVYLAFMTEAGLVDTVVTRFSGFLDSVTIEDAADGLAVMTMNIESNNRELQRSGGRTRSDNDQRQVSGGSNDGFFKRTTVANTNTNIYWGKKGPQKPADPGWFSKLFS